MASRIIAALAALWAACAMPAIAADGMGVTGAEVVGILQAQGYRAKLEKDSEGDPLVRTGMSGVNVDLFFYDCADDRCGSLQFRVGLDLEQGSTPATINGFNSGYRYASAYLDEERDPFLQMDFEVLHASHAEHIASHVDLWQEVLDAFLRVTGFRGAGDAGEAQASTLQ